MADQETIPGNSDVTERRSSTALLGRFFILNDVECPEPKMVTEKREDGYYYVHPNLRREKRYWGMRGSETTTPVEAFGISLELEGNVLRGKLERESTATYRDGRSRLWQGEPKFQIKLKG